MSNTVEKSSNVRVQKMTIRLNNMKVNGDLYKSSDSGEREAKLD